ncbi:hypothetical protein HP550_19250 [Cellulomonas humilata]|uniref:Uncharacterized protein n=1 Tax=Cellulomonas humilata TaxID=144055 RepID=A0A7Y6DZD8_9CELL|nr:hypothetical protein [Cellulomonas humilata]NUU19390.1 hypothetical protein [Cellulomonas humilata]
MTTISVARVRPAALDDERLRALAEAFRVDGDVVRTEEAYAVVGKEATLVHGGPGNRLAGVTTLVDLARGVAATDPEKDPAEPLPADKAVSVASELTERYGLGPAVARIDGVRLESSIDAIVTHAVRFDGKERTRFAVKTDVRARVTLDGIPVTGPRAGVNATFLDDDRPLRLMATTWDAVELYREAELVEEGEVLERVLEAARHRAGRTEKLSVVSSVLAYWAAPYEGGADLLEPSWFVELGHPSDEYGNDGPKQLVRVPATR